jgi:DNA polymerase-3 subunit beta
MNFEIDRDVLLDNLNMIAHGLPQKSPMPILTGIKLEATDTDLFMTASNVDLSVEVLISDASLKIKERGKTVVPGKFFIDIIRKVNRKTIYFESIDDKYLMIKADGVEYNLNIMDYMDYPQIEFVTLQNPLNLDSNLLQTVIRQTIFATSSVEKKPILTGINFKLKGNTLTCVATDSYRFSKKEIDLNQEYNEFDVTIPNKSLDELSKALGQDNTPISLYFSNNKILFKFKNVLFQTRLLEGQYPDTSRFIPQQFPLVIKFNKNDLLEKVEYVSLLSPHEKERDREITYSIIKMSIDDNKNIELNTNNIQIGGVKANLFATGFTGEGPLNIGFSSRYLVEALRSFESSEVTMSFCGELRPFIITSEKDLNLVQLVLPVKLD